MSLAFGFALPHWQAISGGFSPASLFAGGTAGAWYDPSDLSTMFTTSAGTTPVAMPGLGAAVPVGLMLDKSQGLVLGPELVTTPYSGTASGTWAISSTSVTRNSSTSGQATLTLIGAISTSKWYQVQFTVANLSGDTFFYRTGGGGTAYQITSNGVYTARVLGGGTGSSLVFAPWAGGAGEATITNISVRELAGNHAIAFNDTTARPELRARVNLLTYSEDFSNAAWANTAMTVTANATAAPDGSITADTAVPTAVSNLHRLSQNVAVTARTLSVYAKANGYDKIGLKESQTSGEWAAFQLTGSGSVIAVQAGVTASIETLANGWYRCVMTLSAAVSAGLQISALPPSYTGGDVNVSFTGDGTSGYFLWGADLRPANIGANVPAYQRIADANTYDTAGFPLYLRFDGIDDSMYTPANLNLSGTDKVAVFAGVRKLSDGVYPVIAELASDYSANNGSFALFASGSSTPRYGFYLRGSANTGYEPQTYEAPLTNVLAVSYDIGGAAKANEVLPRINGVLNQTNPVSGADAGTGNFGAYPLYIGSRNNSSLRLNGQLYSLIIAGSAVSAGNISATEQWVAGKTGIQI